MAKTNQAYSTPAFKHEIDLRLSGNESQCVIPDLAAYWRQLDSRFVSQYPSHQALQNLIGDWVGVDATRIVVTAGGDDSIDRIVGNLVSETRNKVVTHAPSFEMVSIYTDNYGGSLDVEPWLEGDFPVDPLIARIDASTALVVVTTPNNPTGAMVSLDDIFKVNQAAKKHGAKLLVDHAYVEFADEDPSAQLTADENIMIVRTFSKAWGLAGLRVGFLIAPDAEFATAIRNASGPYPVSAVSLETARTALEQFKPLMVEGVNRIKTIRGLMFDLLTACGGRPLPSGGNYLLTEFSDADAVWDGLAAKGIGVRKFAGKPVLVNFLRITCPATVGDYLRLAKAFCDICDTDFETHQAAAGVAFAPELVADQMTPEASELVAASVDSPDAGTSRQATIKRDTKETKIDLQLNLDGNAKVEISTGIGFLDHMLTAFAFHAGFDLKLICDGDLEVDDHHTAEDCAIALGQAIDEALGPRKGIKRFGYAYAPLDEALARTVVDLSARPWPEIHLALEREMVGQWACENITHFFQSLAMTLRCSLHVDVLRGTNDHHRAEAAFKSMAKAFNQALTRVEGDVPSTKGVL